MQWNTGRNKKWYISLLSVHTIGEYINERTDICTLPIYISICIKRNPYNKTGRSTSGKKKKRRKISKRKEMKETRNGKAKEEKSAKWKEIGASWNSNGSGNANGNGEGAKNGGKRKPQHQQILMLHLYLYLYLSLSLCARTTIHICVCTPIRTSVDVSVVASTRIKSNKHKNACHKDTYVCVLST